MKLGAGIMRYGRHVVFELAEVALRRSMTCGQGRRRSRHGDGKRDAAHGGIIGSFKSRLSSSICEDVSYCC
jgi:hypothetical protein